MRLFSYKNRPVHLGPYPLEELARIEGFADLSGTPSMPVLNFRRDTRENLANAMGPYAAMLDLIRDGFVKKEKGVLPQDHLERANHLKAFAYYQDASQVGVCELSSDCFLKEPRRNPYIKLLEKDYFNKQSKTFAAGIDVVLEELTATLTAPQKISLIIPMRLSFFMNIPVTQSQMKLVRNGLKKSKLRGRVSELLKQARFWQIIFDCLDMRPVVIRLRIQTLI